MNESDIDHPMTKMPDQPVKPDNAMTFGRRCMRTLLLLLLAVGAGAGLSACEDQGPAEQAGEEIDEAVEDAGDAVEDAADDVEDEADGN